MSRKLCLPLATLVLRGTKTLISKREGEYYVET